MAQTNITERDFLKSVWACKDPKVVCRLSEINAFGLSGIRSSLNNVNSRFQPVDPGPSWETIEKTMDAFATLIGKVIPPFKAMYKAQKLFYKPHFQVLKMFDKCFEKYWDTIGFLQWALDTTNIITDKTSSYVRGTGEFSFAGFAPTAYGMNDGQLKEYMSSLRLTSGILSEFDQMLLGDIKEFVIAVTKGLEQLSKVKPAENSIDSIALNRIQEDLTYLYLAFDRQPNLQSWVGSLRHHYDSWRMLENTGRLPFEDYSSLFVKFEAALTDADNSITNLRTFKK